MLQNIDLYSEAVAFIFGAILGFLLDFFRTLWIKVRYRGGAVILTYQGKTVLRRPVSPEKMHEINAEPSEKAVFVKGVISPYGRLGCDPLETDGLITMSHKNRTLTIDLNQDKDLAIAPPLERFINEQVNRDVPDGQLILLNFSHPITSQQQEQITQLTNHPIDTVHDIPCELDNGRSFTHQIRTIVANIPLSSEAWQGSPILINPPAYAPAVATLFAELHGRIGHFPTIIRIRPVADTDPTQYEVAELLNLQKIREEARQQRQSSIKNRQS